MTRLKRDLLRKSHYFKIVDLPRLETKIVYLEALLFD